MLAGIALPREVIFRKVFAGETYCAERGSLFFRYRLFRNRGAMLY